MRALIVSLCVFCLSSTACADFWLERAGGSGEDQARSVAVDTDGNVYSAGYFSGRASFANISSAQPRFASFSSAGGRDIFVGKKDRHGNWLWLNRAGGSGDDEANGVAVDAQQNVYLTGTFQGRAAFGATALSTSSEERIALDRSQLSFSAANWNVPQTVRVSALDNLVRGDTQEVPVNLVFSGGDPGFQGVTGSLMVKVWDNDAQPLPGLVFSKTSGSLSLAEGNLQGGSYSVSLAAVPAQDVTVLVTSGDARLRFGATAETFLNLVFTAATWRLPQQVQIQVREDLIPQSSQVVTLNHVVTSADPAYQGLAVPDYQVSVVDNDVPGLWLLPAASADPVTTIALAEAADPSVLHAVSLRVVLATRPSQQVTVQLSDAGRQVEVSPASVSFAPADWDGANPELSIPKTVTVTALDDHLVEGTPHYSQLTLTSTSTDTAYQGLALQVPLRLTDNDAAGVTLTGFPCTVPTVSEKTGTNPARYSVQLDSQPSAAVTVSLSATEAQQLDLQPPTLSFDSGNWNTPQQVTVQAVVDGIAEFNPHQVTLLHNVTSSDPRYQGLAVAALPVTIEDADSATGTALLFEKRVLIVNRGAAPGDTYQVRIASKPDNEVYLKLECDVGALALSLNGLPLASGGTLVFNSSNWELPQTVSVQGRLAGSLGTAAITHSVLQADGTTWLEIPGVAVRIVDDGPRILVVGAPTGTQVAEGGSGDTVTVSLSRAPLGTVRVELSGVPAGQLNLSPTSLNFDTTNWNQPVAVALQAVDDGVIQGDRTVQLTLAVSTADSDHAFLGVSQQRAVRVLDNDQAGLVLSSQTLSVTEAGAAANYQVSLAAAPSQPVSVTITPSVAGQLSVAGASQAVLTFTPDTWQNPQQVAVRAGYDGISQGTHSVQLSHVLASADPRFQGAAAPTLTVSLTDTVLPYSIIQAPGGVQVGEDGRSDSFQVVLNRQPSSDITVTLSTLFAVSSSKAAFVAKLAPDGSWLWTKPVGGGDQASGNGIAVSAAGEVTVVGTASPSATIFGPYTLANLGGEDVFAVRFDTGGSWLWANRLGTAGNDRANGVTLDQAGNAYLAAYYARPDESSSSGVDLYDTVCVSHFIICWKYGQVYAGRRTTTTTDYGSGFELVKLNGANGLVLKSVSAGGEGFEQANAVAFQEGTPSYLYLSGEVSGTACFDGKYRKVTSFWDYLDNNRDTTTIDSADCVNAGARLAAAQPSALVARYRSDTLALDTVGWPKALLPGGTGTTAARGSGIAVAGGDNGRVLVTGESVAASGEHRLFTVGLGLDGSEKWQTLAGGPVASTAASGEAGGTGLALAPAGDLYLSGYLKGTARFGTPPDQIGLVSSGAADALVGRLDPATGQWRNNRFRLAVSLEDQNGQPYQLKQGSAAPAAGSWWYLSGTQVEASVPGVQDGPVNFLLQWRGSGSVFMEKSDTTSNPGQPGTVRVTSGRERLVAFTVDQNSALSWVYSQATQILVGQPVTRPVGAYADADFPPDIEIKQGPSGSAPENSFFWHTLERNSPVLYAIRPVIAEVRWRTSSDSSSSQRAITQYSFVWPEEGHPSLHLHPKGAPVRLASRDGSHNFSQVAYTDNGAQVMPVVNSLTGASVPVFGAGNPGYSVLMFVQGSGSNPLEAPISFEVVRSVAFDQQNSHFQDGVAQEIGRQISDPAHKVAGENGYLLFERAPVDAFGSDAAYNRENRSGILVPVNRVLPGVHEDLVVVWYDDTGAKRVPWPSKWVRYLPAWPASPDRIVIASGLGSELGDQQRLKPADFPQRRIYHQPDRTKAGYNPNDEHALFAPSNAGSGFDALFALRDDLSTDPYAILKFKDPVLKQWAYKLYRVSAEDAAHTLYYDSALNAAGQRVNLEAGKQIQPPYPISRFLPACKILGTGVPYWQDHKGAPYAKAAGECSIFWYYPLQDSFYYDPTDTGVDQGRTGSCVAWLGKNGGDPLREEEMFRLGLDPLSDLSRLRPRETAYRFAWPEQVPVLYVGETLMKPKRGLPEIKDQAAAAIVFDEQDPDGTNPAVNAAARLFDPLSERYVELAALPSAIVTQSKDGRKVFSDLPFALRQRVGYDPLNGRLAIKGYLDESGVGEPLLLLNVLSSRERDRLKALSQEKEWRSAVDQLYAKSRDPNGLGGLNAGVSIVESSGGTEVSEEGATSDSYTVVLNSAPKEDVTISLTMLPSGQVTLNHEKLIFTKENWSQPQTVTVTALDDASAEGDQTVTISHAPSSADPLYGRLALGSVRVRVVDNDTPGIKLSKTRLAVKEEGPTSDSYTMELTSRPSGAVTVSIATSSAGQVALNLTSLLFTVANWHTPQRVTVTARDDTLPEGPHQVTLTHSAFGSDYGAVRPVESTVLIADNDSLLTVDASELTLQEEGPTTRSYTVRLNKAPAGPLTVTNVLVPAYPEQARVTPATLSFSAANWNVPQTVSVTAVDDNLVQGEHVVTLEHRVEGSDSDFRGLVRSVRLRIIDNDKGIPVSRKTLSVKEEGATSDSYTLVLNTRPTGEVIVTPRAQVPGQLLITPAALSFTPANWNVPQQVTVSAVDDTLNEGAQQVTIAHSASGSDPDYRGSAIADVTVSIADNDRPEILVSRSALSVKEEGSTSDSYTVSLASRPGGPVSIVPAVSDPAQARVAPAQLLFTPENWSQPQTVSVSAVSDLLQEGPHQVTVSHQVLGAEYTGLAAPTLSVAIADNESGNAPLMVGLWDDSSDTQLKIEHQPLIGVPKALSAGISSGAGYLTLAFNNDPSLGALPVSLSVLRVECPVYTGEIKVVNSDNLFDEKLTLRHSGDFGGDPDRLAFEWYYRSSPAPEGLANPDPDQGQLYGWLPFVDPDRLDGKGVADITIEGASPLTISDNLFLARYKGYPACGGSGWSSWAGAPGSSVEQSTPQLAEGWIKRVVEELNPFEARGKDFERSETNTYADMLSQAGRRYEGPIALSNDPGAINKVGLIEAYGTVLDRGEQLSVNGSPPVRYQPANDALLLAASRIADLYLLLGNEAYGDAQDPTIGFGTESGVYGNLAPTIFAFQNQLGSLLDEELALLRGTSTPLAQPVYNRLIWNFTNAEGELAYSQIYNVRDLNNDGVIDEKDAAILYPQGHGDAWGHYLTAQKTYYDLLRNPNFDWQPRAEQVLVAGTPVNVDYLDERKFAQIAAARAKTGAEIVDLTYRGAYVEDPAGQWQGYKDGDAERAWGLDEWSRRAGQGAYFDWIAGNALLSAEDTAHTGIQKIDRKTVRELSEIVAQYSAIQTQVDEADQGLNPLGLARGVVPFDIDPSRVAAGETHFEQVQARAVKALNNAVQVFNHANQQSEMLRRNQDTLADFTSNVGQREKDFRNRLIEIFGYPYVDDIGPGGTYPSEYDGPDLYHYMYVEPSELAGSTASKAREFKAYFDAMPNVGVFPDYPSDVAKLEVTYSQSTDRLELVKPGSWTGQRRAPGQLQQTLSNLQQARARMEKAHREYLNHLDNIKAALDALEGQQNLKATEINTVTSKSVISGVANGVIAVADYTATVLETASNVTSQIADATAESLPKSVGLSSDVTSAARGAIKLSGSISSKALIGASKTAQKVKLGAELAKEAATLATDIALVSGKTDFEVAQKVRELEQLVRAEAPLRLELYTQQEVVHQSAGQYLSILAKGEQLLEELIAFRSATAASVQRYRYQDMAFRVFRNDALQKYRAAFDLAARYTFLAATAYDYETNLLGSDRGAGREFLTDIVRQRSLGQLVDGKPLAGAPGLGDPLARMAANFEVYKGQLGFNNPQTETNRFSLRSGLFRLRDTSDAAWRTELEKHRVANLWDIPEFRRYCRPFAPESAGAQPGIVIQIPSTVTFGLNFFGFPLSGGDSAYDATNFATRVRSVGTWFSNYNGTGLSQTPRVYLVPAGMDILRTPAANNFATREWRVIDQALPVPFPIGSLDLADPNWIPAVSTLSDDQTAIRRFSSFRAYHDSGSLTPSELNTDSRLIGRSVWNTRWLLIIPGGNLLSDANDGLDTLIYGQQVPAVPGLRDGKGISDIKLFFQTYAYSGN